MSGGWARSKREESWRRRRGRGLTETCGAATNRRRSLWHSQSAVTGHPQRPRWIRSDGVGPVAVEGRRSGGRCRRAGRGATAQKSCHPSGTLNRPRARAPAKRTRIHAPQSGVDGAQEDGHDPERSVARPVGDRPRPVPLRAPMPPCRPRRTGRRRRRGRRARSRQAPAAGLPSGGCAAATPRRRGVEVNRSLVAGLQNDPGRATGVPGRRGARALIGSGRHRGSTGSEEGCAPWRGGGLSPGAPRGQFPPGLPGPAHRPEC